MLRKVIAILFLVALSSTPAYALFGRTKPVYNIVDAPIVTSSGKVPTSAQIDKAFTDAAHYKGWTVETSADGALIASIHVRQHYAEIAMTHTDKTYSITYRDSKVLMYDGKEIHRNYNKWVMLLDDEFRKNLNRL